MHNIDIIDQQRLKLKKINQFFRCKEKFPMYSLFDSNILFEVVLAVIYIEFALSCFSSLKITHFTLMFTFKRIICFWIIITAQSLNNWIFRLLKYQPFVDFSLDILRDPEQRKLEFFYTAFFVGFLKFTCLTGI